jgi:repressor LexA
MSVSLPTDRLSPAQARVLAFIEAHIVRHGLPPTRGEICAALGFRSPNAAEAHLRTLARKGVIELLPRAARGIRLRSARAAAQHPAPHVAEYDAEPSVGGMAGLAIVGRVAAGSPVLAEQHIEGRCPVQADWFHPRADYLLRVHGESMRDAGMLDGDLLAVHSIGVALNGQIVVARLNDEVTVKRFQRNGHQVLLLPENPDFAPIDIDLRVQPVVIEGLGVGLIRNGLPRQPAPRGGSRGHG